MNPAVLSFWQIVEFLTPPGLPQPGRDEGVVRLDPTEPPPWSPEIARRPLRKGYGWRHVVYGGALSRGGVIEEIRRRFAVAPDETIGLGSGGLTALYSLTLDTTGRVASGGFAVSSLPWAMGRVEAWRQGEVPDLRGFDDFTRAVRAAVVPLLAGEEPVGPELLDDIAVRIAAEAGWPEVGQLQGHIAKSWPVRLRGGGEAEAADLLNSFYVGDLHRVRAALVAGEIGAALASYLESEPAPPELDVRGRPDAVAAALHPARLPPGAWPAPPDQIPVRAQQFALNEAWGRLRDGGLFSVNGPPGTGKTTLLRDVVAGVVTARADVLASLENPADAFRPYERSVAVNGRSLSAWTVIEALRGYEIVVASSNNGAVENVSREIPARRHIDEALGGDAAYFPEVATSLLRPRPDAGPVDGADDPAQPDFLLPAPAQGGEPGWAMLAAVLGNGANVSRFVHDFWFGRPSADDPHLVTFRRVLEDGRAAPPDWGAARQAFLDARAALSAAAEAVPAPEGLEGLEGDEETRQKSPAVAPELQAARVRLFLRALDLHRAFLLNAGAPLRDNLGLAVDMLRGLLPPGAADLRVQLWATLFLAVPVVSTTFASVARLFRGLGRESLGWLLIDEAGQALPQAAVGALWRARRALVIGDLRQLEPVASLPEEVLELLRRRLGIDPVWSGSAQGLADRRNPVGARLGSGADAVWVGAPLRVHRRCAAPMFAIANRIAYDDLMVQGVEDDPDFETPLGRSAWFDIAGTPSSGHFIEEQGDLALRLIATAMARLGSRPSLFVISPFRTVVTELHRRLAPHVDPEWRRLSVGTVHTFQGKEADQVVLLLGGDPATPRALAWAAERPNLLNVAVTRARRRLYVVGDRARWGRLPYFDTLAEMLPRRRAAAPAPALAP